MGRSLGVNRMSAWVLMLAFCSFTSIAGQSSAIKGSPADAAVVNKERVLYWLIEHGDVSENDSNEIKQAAVLAFIERSGRHQFKLPNVEVKAEHNRAKLIKASKSSASQAANGLALADTDITKTVKVLAVLIDFPDLPYNANKLKAADTDMFYTSYPVSHYKNLLFSPTGFSGPQSQNLQSGYQYFQAASGGSFFFTGDVRGWYRASNNAAYYGGNDAANDDNSDKAVPELIKEAVTQAVAGMSAETLNSYDIEDPYDLDGDQNVDESDGVIDHVMVFHSSIGEEAGGGVLKEDAIWSHRYFVDQGTGGYTLPGKSKKLFGYTIQPIDAAIGVCTHEFGHDLGLPDEYDTSQGSTGSPVGMWSLMSGGSWVGKLAGTEPSGFSPYARSYLQARYKGKWVNERVVTSASLTNSGVDITLNRAVDADKLNQISITLPPSPVPFKAPFSGSFQYHSGSGNLINTALSFEVDFPIATPLTLSFKARWDIEQDYDYMQVLVDGVAVAGNRTKVNNPEHAGIKHYISGTSVGLAGASGADSWVTLTYDLTAYAGQNKRISLVYVTDSAEGGYGMAIDEISLHNNANVIYSDDAETVKTGVLLNGFSRIEDTIAGKDRRYLVQLRDYTGIDAGLKAEGYEPGVLLWLENHDQGDNDVANHPGASLIGVVDADQEIIGSPDTTNTDVQIRDAAFSLYDQKAYSADTHLTANSLFDDSQDYSAPLKPLAGMKLDPLGITMEVISQRTDTSQAVIRLRKADGQITVPTVLQASFSVQVSEAKVNFTPSVTGGDGRYYYDWTFGVANASSVLISPEYTYVDSGDYRVTLVVTDGAGVKFSTVQTVRVVLKPVASFTVSKNHLAVTVQSTASKGFGGLSYSWNFGDLSAIGSGANASHTYGAAGSYTVTLTVTDTLGNSHAASQNVTVTAASGGSLGWLSCLGLAILAWRRR